MTSEDKARLALWAGTATLITGSIAGLGFVVGQEDAKKYGTMAAGATTLMFVGSLASLWKPR